MSTDTQAHSENGADLYLHPVDIEEIGEFLRYIHLELNRSLLTLSAYGRDIRQFAAWITGGDSLRFSPDSVTASDIRTWLTLLAKSGETTRTLRRKLQSLRAFWRFLMKRGLVHTSPAADVTLPKISRDLPGFAKTEQIEAILADAPDPSDPEGVQEHLIITFLYSTGIRQAELLGIDDSDISVSLAEARITGKRNKQRIVPLPAPLLDEIAAWQTLRDSVFPPPEEGKPLFRGPDGSRMSKSRLYATVRAMLSQTSATHKGPHTLRHTFATAMLNNGADLDTVKEFLGHRSLSTTQIYTHLSFSQLRRDYDKAHPRKKNKKNTT